MHTCPWDIRAECPRHKILFSDDPTQLKPGVTELLLLLCVVYRYLDLAVTTTINRFFQSQTFNKRSLFCSVRKQN
jgi:hypothetical protein